MDRPAKGDVPVVIAADVVPVGGRGRGVVPVADVAAERDEVAGGGVVLGRVVVVAVGTFDVGDVEVVLAGCGNGEGPLVEQGAERGTDAGRPDARRLP